MLCPVCAQRKARRTCPALGQTICTICCGTKRLVEIDCPASCVHLSVAREHPAAAVRRQQEQDVAMLMPAVQRLTERQHQLFFLFQSVIARHKPEGFARLVDDDIAEAAASVAATLETAARGVIYEHVAASLSAQRLAAEMKALLGQIREQGATVYDAEVAIALRAIEQGARDPQVRAMGDDAYLQLVGRLLQANRAARGTGPETKPASSLIVVP
jgi:hypothetical protein